MMRQILLVGLVVVHTAICCALDMGALTAVAQRVTREQYPDADYVIVDDVTRNDYDTNGASLTLSETCLKVLTEKGKRENRTLSFGYDIAYGSVIVERVEIVKPDGAIVPVDIAAQSREMTDNSQMRMNIYNPNSKILQVSVPALDIGDLLYYRARRIEFKPRMPETWSDYSVFEATVPILHARQEVYGPTTLPLQHTLLKAAVSNTVTAGRTTLDGTNAYIWEVEHVPQAFPEPNMPAFHTVAQRLLLSTIPDWPTVSRWYDALCEPRLQATTPAMTNAVMELIAGAATPRERLERVFHYVSQNIRYMGITTEDVAPGYEPHDVNITFANKYGVCRDKAALLVALLRIAGFKAYPVLIYVGPKKDAEVPQPYFNHAITAVEEADGSYTLMDSTDENTRELLPSYLCDCSYLVAKPEGDELRVSPIVPAEENMLVIDTDAALDPQGNLSARVALRFYGINDNAYRGLFSRQRKEERTQMFEGLVKRITPGATLDAVVIRPEDPLDVSTNLSVELRYSARDVLVKGPHALMMPSLWFGTALGVVNFVIGQTGLEQRRYPFVTQFACGVREHITARVSPAVGAALALPTYERTAASNLVWDVTMSATAGVLQAVSDFRIEAVEFSPAEYLQLKSTLKTIEFDRRKRALFTPRAGNEEADVQLLDLQTVFDLRAVTQMIVSSTVHKKILTYNGKKQNAELKLNYNPAWETVTLDNVFVIDTAGVTNTISDKEINIMDAGWVASAPRYPGDKTLVASLPAVDVGCVIEYQTRRVLYDRPFWSFSDAFRAFEPIERQSVTVLTSSDHPLIVTNVNAENISVTTTVAASTVSTTWRADAQTAVKPERDLPPWWSFLPGMAASDGTWPAYAQCVDDVLRAAAQSQPLSAAKARELTAAASNRTAAVQAIRDFVAMQIRPAGPTLLELPLRCITPADRTLTDGYGNNADRAVLSYALLAGAGFEPEFVLASWEQPLAGVDNPMLACPQRSVFSDVLVRVTVDGNTMYLNDTDQYDALGATAHDGRYGLTLPDGTLMTIRAAAHRRNQGDVRYTIALDDDGNATIAYERRFHGTSYGRFHQRFAELQPEDRRRAFLEMVAGISQAAVATSDLTTEYTVYPGIERYSVHAPRYAVRDGDYLYVSLPGASVSVPGVVGDTRVNPVYWSLEDRATTVITLQLPPAFTNVQIAPAAIAWRAPAGGRVTFSTTHTNNVLTFVRRITMRPTVLDSHIYPELLEMNRTLSHPATRTVLVTRDQ